MNKGLIAFLGFCGGGVAGFFAGKKLLEEHYNQVVQEEIDSVKKAFRRQMKSMETAKPAAAEKTESPVQAESDAKTDKVALAKKLKAEGLSNAEAAKKMGINESTIRSLLNDSSDGKKKDYRMYYPEKKVVAPVKEEPKEEKKTSPYVIPPEDFGTNAGYEEISLTYYADGVVADDDDNAMSDEDIEETIGHESLKHFGEYEDDSVFVRNDDMRTDYEILQDERRYKDAMSNKAYQNPNQ
jgi:predicted DNA-binding protein (UPF0251 family)